MTRKIAVTAIKWTDEYANAIHKGLAAASAKYNGDLLVIVGYTIIGLKIASVASAENISVQMFAPDIDFRIEAIDVVDGITITSTSKPDYMKYMVERVDGVMAFDKGDPIVLTAKRLNKPVWFPLGDEA